MADRAASLLERSGKHFFPAGSIEKGDIDGVFDESGYAGRLPACDQGSDVAKLLIGQRDGNLRSRHTIYHTTWLVTAGMTTRLRSAT